MAARLSRSIRALALALLCLLVVTSGCRRRPAPPQDDPAASQPEAPAAVEKPAPVEPDPPAPQPEPLPPLRIEVLLSDDAQQYNSVARSLSNLAGADVVSLYTLDPASGAAPANLRAADPRNVVAIGLPAALASLDLDHAKFVFCQVLNYEGHGLITGSSRGIDTIPDLDAAIRLWRQLDPDLVSIGVITGSGHAARLARARSSLDAFGIELVHRTTESDKETLLEFQRLVPEIDGFWLFPDNRVLSTSTIREIMSLARRSKIGVLANDPGFHQVGAFLCAAPEPDEIALHARELLDQSRDSASFEGRAVVPLSRAKVSVDAGLASQLGYAIDSIPPELLAR